MNDSLQKVFELYRLHQFIMNERGVTLVQRAVPIYFNTITQATVEESEEGLTLVAVGDTCDGTYITWASSNGCIGYQQVTPGTLLSHQAYRPRRKPGLLATFLNLFRFKKVR